MKNTSVLLFYAVIALYAFFVVAPCTLNAVSLFTVQKRFTRTMIDEGVVSAAEVARLHPKKQIAGVVISVILLGVLADLCVKMAPMGYLCGGIALAAGFLKYRQVLQFNSLTVDRFRNTYKDVMDGTKYNRYVSEHF
ncbi:MAG: hypothetical protein KBS74_00765 [Clostridiales bacterium]|nr:hypothetical protein [Candidatus Cacconaster stercorequi]